MTIDLGPETQRLLEAQMKKGGYHTPDDALRAGLLYLEQQEHAGDFEPAELDELLAVADAEIERGEVLDGEEVFRELREQRNTCRNEPG